MVKDINIHTTFEDKNHIFQCPQKEFIKKAAEYFNIAPEDMVLFAVQKGKKNQISYNEITDLMKVEIVNKNTSSVKSNNQRTLKSFYSDQLPPKNDNFDLIISKLQNNSPLTGIQRKRLTDWLDEYINLPTSLKRKLSEAKSKPEKAHKKIQATVCLYQDGVSQTGAEPLSVDGFNSPSTSTNVPNDLAEVAPERERYNAEQRDIIAEMKKICSQERQNEEEVSKLMAKSYEARRNYILIQKPKVAVVKSKYPLLFSATQVMNELDRIFYPDKQKEFLMNIEKYSNAILIAETNSSRRQDDITLKVKHALSFCDTPEQRKYVTEIGSILLVPKLVKEGIGFINLADNPVQDDSIIDYPYIDAGHMEISDLFLTDEPALFKIIAEQQLLCEVNNLKDAVLCLLACFFIFNIHYPNFYYNTYVLFEKLYLLANDTEVHDNNTEQMIKYIRLVTETN